jgi:hypothetical protein
MTGKIRRRHLFAWFALALLVPLLIAAGVGLRHREPVNRTVPARMPGGTR